MGNVLCHVNHNLEHTAIIDGQETLTYSELRYNIKQLANALPRYPLSQKYGLVMDQTVMSIQLFLAILEKGHAVLPVDNKQTPAEMSRIQQISGITTWVVPTQKKNTNVNLFERNERMESESCHNHDHMSLYTYDDIYHHQHQRTEAKQDINHKDAQPQHVQAQPTFVYQLTSGTTGYPKMACVSLQTIIREGHVYRSWFQYAASDHIIATIPLHHLYGMTGALFASLLTGSTLVLCRHPTPRKVFKLSETYRSTILLSVPSFYPLLSDAHTVQQKTFQHMRFAISAGGPLPQHVSRQFKQKTNVTILELYGSTETGAVAAHHPQRKHLEGSNGFILPDVKVKIAKDQSLVVSSPSLFHGYITVDQEKEGHDRTSDMPGMMKAKQWHKTDDLAVLHEQQLFLKGRKTTFINVAGRKVNPKEVEAACRTIPEIVDVVVRGKEDQLHGEIIVAEVILSAYKTVREMKTALRKQLAAYKIPHQILIVEEIKKSWKQS
ncbi:class I adenylate-forming enzyme family protein [Longirhabdus pacifica]|uniref:class I adenylate-forming enzyme family protein n=1 Tax=Longirhabdus pacifica TaxID=2305227 RepID=UPI0013E8BBEC|nr:class I adenylate-forming enzyme family protein [Longirhabdus pacifica]